MIQTRKTKNNNNSNQFKLKIITILTWRRHDDVDTGLEGCDLIFDVDPPDDQKLGDHRRAEVSSKLSDLVERLLRQLPGRLEQV